MLGDFEGKLKENRRKTEGPPSARSGRNSHDISRNVE
jgi:hypothetical protein